MATLRVLPRLESRCSTETETKLGQYQVPGNGGRNNSGTTNFSAHRPVRNSTEKDYILPFLHADDTYQDECIVYDAFKKKWLDRKHLQKQDTNHIVLPSYQKIQMINVQTNKIQKKNPFLMARQKKEQKLPVLL